MIPPTQPFPLQIAAGPYSYIVSTELVLGEGEPFLIGVIAANGQVLSGTLWGGHDVANKLLAGGFQGYSGPTTPLTAPRGLSFVDSNLDIWISDGSNWVQKTGVSPPAPPPGTVDGGTWV